MRTLTSAALVLGATAAGAAAMSCRLQFPNLPPTARFTCSDFPELAPDLPADVDLPSHPNTQCFAWQEFIALNWPAARGRAGEPDRGRRPSTFGQPGDTAPVVWETFKEAHEVFLPDAAPPRPWGESGLLESLPASFAAAPLAAAKEQSSGFLVLRMTSKVSPQAPRLERVMQAGGGWLTAQNGTLTHYGIHMNRTEFEYIVRERFYDARRQAGTFVNLPPGRSGGTPEVGSIELKSAWVEITPRSRRRYHTARACIVEGDHCRMALVGLVGLHIVHKTETFPQWSWATFEHVDNAPDREEIRQGTLRRRYTYFDPSCPAGSTDPRCVPNRIPTEPRDRPVQVVRQTPIPESSRQLNGIVHKLIHRANRRSVWQYYNLVDVQWPQAAETIGSLSRVPLPRGGMTPTSVANATIETYVQHDTCIDCHRSATVACPGGGSCAGQASDYSFLFILARESPP